jgi:hypothetical protein
MNDTVAERKRLRAVLENALPHSRMLLGIIDAPPSDSVAWHADSCDASWKFSSFRVETYHGGTARVALLARDAGAFERMLASTALPWCGMFLAVRAEHDACSAISARLTW